MPSFLLPLILIHNNNTIQRHGGHRPLARPSGRLPQLHRRDPSSMDLYRRRPTDPYSVVGRPHRLPAAAVSTPEHRPVRVSCRRPGSFGPPRRRPLRRRKTSVQRGRGRRALRPPGRTGRRRRRSRSARWARSAPYRGPCYCPTDHPRGAGVRDGEVAKTPVGQKQEGTRRRNRRTHAHPVRPGLDGF